MPSQKRKTGSILAMKTFSTGTASAILFFTLTLSVCITPVNAILPAFIKGTVFDTFNNAVISGAVITTNTGGSTTATSGSFSLRVPPNIYSIIVNAPSFNANILAGIFAAPGQTAIINISLSPSSTATGAVEGHIMQLDTGQGIKGAIVTTDLGGATFSSDDNGHFRLLTPSGITTITVIAEGFAGRAAKNISIPPHKTTRLNFYLTKPPSGSVTIEGVIQDACTGTRIDNAVVISNAGAIEISNNGFYSIQTSPGTSTLLVTAEGYHFNQKTFNLAPNTTKLVNFYLPFTDSGSGLVKGIVINQSTGDPIEQVRLESETGEVSFSNEDGSYQLFSSVCATSIAAAHEGFMPATRRVAIIRGSTSLLNFSLNPLGRISGVVVDGLDNHGIDGALISLEEDTNISAVSDRNGNYILENIIPGNYTLQTLLECYLPATKAAVDISFGETAEENITLQPKSVGTLQGLVSDLVTGAPVASASIRASHGSEALSDADGFYSADLPACQTDFTIMADGFLSQTKRGVLIKADEIVTLDINLIPCPVAMTANIAAADRTSLNVSLAALRKFRDQVLLQHSILRNYTISFYAHALEIAKILYQNPALREKARHLLLQATEMLAVKSTTRAILADEHFIKEVCLFLEDFMRKSAFTDLNSIISNLQQDLKTGALVTALEEQIAD